MFPSSQFQICCFRFINWFSDQITNLVFFPVKIILQDFAKKPLIALEQCQAVIPDDPFANVTCRKFELLVADLDRVPLVRLSDSSDSLRSFIRALPTNTFFCPLSVPCYSVERCSVEQ